MTPIPQLRPQVRGRAALVRQVERLERIVVTRAEGVPTIERLRENPKYATLPVLALTAYAMVGDQERVLAAGFTAYIAKPIDRKKLLEAIAFHLGKQAAA